MHTQGQDGWRPVSAPGHEAGRCQPASRRTTKSPYADRISTQHNNADRLYATHHPVHTTSRLTCTWFDFTPGPAVMSMAFSVMPVQGMTDVQFTYAGDENEVQAGKQTGAGSCEWQRADDESAAQGMKREQQTPAGQWLQPGAHATPRLSRLPYGISHHAHTPGGPPRCSGCP